MSAIDIYDNNETELQRRDKKIRELEVQYANQREMKLKAREQRDTVAAKLKAAQRENLRLLRMFVNPSRCEDIKWGGRPTKTGYFLIKGFDYGSQDRVTSVIVSSQNGQLMCNLNEYNTDPLHECGMRVSDMDDAFEWAELVSI